MSKPRLVEELVVDIPIDKITIKMLKSMDYGEDIELDNNFTISHHSQEDMIDIFHTETWTNLFSVLWNWETDDEDSIILEQVYHDDDTY
tara:strand:- start:336 stop:602 length:267 start_codon:yes stop_codon:yes gene_type:complete